MNIRKISKVNVQAKSTIFNCSNCDKIAELRCTRCCAVKYCSEDCQEAQWNDHKPLCHLIKKLTKEVHEKATTIDSFGRVCLLTSSDLFDSQFVGYFWDNRFTQCYCNSRNNLAVTLYKCGYKNNSKLAYELALEHMLDLICLCRYDCLGVRNYIPTIYLMLNKHQEAYDCFKFWNTFDCEFYDENEDEYPIIFPDMTGENILESLQCLQLNPCTPIEEVLSLFLIKFMVFRDIKQKEYLETKASYEGFMSIITDTDIPLLNAVGSCLPALDLIKEHVMRNVNKKVHTLKVQLDMLHTLMNFLNPYIVQCFWHSSKMCDNLNTKESAHYKKGSFGEAYHLVSHFFVTWRKIPGLLNHMKKLFVKLYGKQKANESLKEVKKMIIFTEILHY